jgi:ankyrin repeat protein
MYAGRQPQLLVDTLGLDLSDEAERSPATRAALAPPAQTSSSAHYTRGVTVAVGVTYEPWNLPGSLTGPISGAIAEGATPRGMARVVYGFDAIEQFIEAAAQGHLAAVQADLVQGIDANALGCNGQTALMVAASAGHLPVIEALLAAGADVNTRSSSDDVFGPGETALIKAAASFFVRDRAAVLGLLIEAGANVNIKDGSGQTALMYVLTNTDLVEMLLTAGAQVNERNAYGQTALMLAEDQGYWAVAARLRKVQPVSLELSAIALLDAASDGDYLAVQRYLQSSVDPVDCATALVYACAAGHFDVALLLLKAKANPNPDLGPGYFTPLMYAAYAGRLDVLCTLLQAGANPTISNEDGFTALKLAELAAYEGNDPQGQYAEVVQVLQQVVARQGNALVGSR